MADTRTVNSVSGGDHTTVQDAIDWFVDTWDGSGIGSVEIENKAQYSEKLTIDNIAGTRSSTSYLEMYFKTAAWGNGVSPWPDGTYDSSISGGLTWSTAGQHVVNVNEDYTHLHHLAIYQNSTQTSDEGVTMRSAVEHVLIEKCVIQVNSQDQQDPIYMYANSSATRSCQVYDCVLLGEGTGSRSGFNCQQTGAAGTTTNWIVNCTINNSGSTVTLGGSGAVLCQKAVEGATVNMNVYNNILFNNGNGHTVYDNNFSSTWTGQGNVGETTYIDTYMGATGNTDSVANSEFGDDAADDVRFTDMTSSTDADYQILEGTGDSNNYCEAYCNNIYGSLDSRLTFTEDIAGNPRATTATDRWTGAYELVAASSNYEGDLTAATYAYTEKSLTLNSEYVVNLSAATYAHTEKSLSLERPKQNDLSAATYAHAPQNLTWKADYTPQLTAATYAHTAKNLSWSSVWNGNLTSATYAYTANAITHALGVTNELTKATYAHTAKALTWTAAYLGNLSAATYAHTAKDLEITAGVIFDLTSAAYAHTTKALTWTAQYVADLSAATYTHAAKAITFTSGTVTVRTLLSSVTKLLTRPLTRTNTVTDVDE